MMCAMQIVLIVYLSSTIFTPIISIATTIATADKCSNVKTVFDINKDLTDSVSKLETWKSNVNKNLEEIKLQEQKMKFKAGELDAALEEQSKQIKTIMSTNESKTKISGTNYESNMNTELLKNKDDILNYTDVIEESINARLVEIVKGMEERVNTWVNLMDVKIKRMKEGIYKHMKDAMSDVDKRIIALPGTWSRRTCTSNSESPAASVPTSQSSTSDTASQTAHSEPTSQTPVREQPSEQVVRCQNYQTYNGRKCICEPPLTGEFCENGPRALSITVAMIKNNKEALGINRRNCRKWCRKIKCFDQKLCKKACSRVFRRKGKARRMRKSKKRQ